jgi:hypothetical protein
MMSPDAFTQAWRILQNAPVRANPVKADNIRLEARSQLSAEGGESFAIARDEYPLI